MRTPEEEAFDHWWARNHPHDWLARHHGGQPISSHDRLLIWDLCRDAFLRREGSYNASTDRYSLSTSLMSASGPGDKHEG